MIKIITEHVDMPLDKRYKLIQEGNFWIVKDTQPKLIAYRSRSFENATIACHNLNKRHYREIKWK